MALAHLADLSQLLAEVFLEPDADLGEVLAALASEGLAPALQAPLRRMLDHPLAAEDQAVEYTRLFLQARDTDTVHLFESVQARGHHMVPEILGPLGALYDEADLSLQEEVSQPPDHLGLELACLSFLLGQLVEGDPAEGPRFADLARRLIREHLSPFVQAVAGQLPQVSAHAYYLAASELAAALLPEAEKALAAF